MKYWPKEMRWVLFGLTVVGLLLFTLSLFPNIPEGGADNYAHFNISKWAFKYPYLFLDHWGKPLFTILTALPAQIGMPAVRIFNIVAGLLTAWLIYRLAIYLKWSHTWFAVVPVIFTPIYFCMMSSAMTEVLFSLVMVTAIYLFFKEKYIASALAISFIILVRTEGLALLLLFFIGFLIKRSYKAIPFLFTGFILFSLIGWLYHFNDFWWLINERPYATGAPSVYGSGAWYYFIVKMPYYYGYIIALLLFGGSFVIFISWLRQRFKVNSDAFFFILLVLGSFWGYFFIHSFLWWKGETSAGLFRVMAATSPLISLMALYLINILTSGIKSKSLSTPILMLLTIVLVYTSAKQYHKSVSYDPSAEILTRASNWLKRPENFRHKLVIHNPYFIFSTGKDGWDVNVVQNGFSNNDLPEEGLPDSTLFVWDAHFSANEGRMPLGKIMDNRNFEIVTCLYPVVPFTVLGGYDYKICIFRKITDINIDNHARLETMQQYELKENILYSESFDFEQPFENHIWDSQRLQDKNNSLNFLYNLYGVDFSPSFHVPEKIIDREKEYILQISARIQINESISPGRLLFVFSIEDSVQALHYTTSDLMGKDTEIGTWEEKETTFIIPEEIAKGTILKAYIWNLDRKDVLLDSIQMKIIESK